ncbi:MAG: CHRD domain-containing protein [Candidatus Nitrosocosmicus sp.]
MKTISKIFNYVDFSISKKNRHIANIAIIIAAISIITIAAIPAFSYAQQQQAQVSDFIANLSGKDVNPPVNTPATGVAKFHVNPNDTISYEISVNNIDKVIDSFMGPKNNTDLIELINPYATTLSGPRDINQFKSAYPTGPVNGILTSGVITTDQFIGPLTGKSISDLANMMKTGQFQVDVRTIAHENGEIAGQIVPAK